MPLRFLTALPVYNEENYVEQVLESVSRYAEDILVVDDGSSDGTAQRLAAFNQRVHVITHQKIKVMAQRSEPHFNFAAKVITMFSLRSIAMGSTNRKEFLSLWLPAVILRTAG